MALTRFAIARPFLTALLTVVLIVLGLLAWRRLPVDLNPPADLPLVQIVTVYPGASPSAVEDQVAEPFERALRTVPNLEHVITVSQDSFCYTMAEFALGSDIDDAIDACREAIDSISGELPDELHDPVFSRLDINAQPVLFMGVVGNRPLTELRALTEEVLAPRLRGVQGVTAVDVLGGREREVLVAVDLEKLLSAGLRLSTLADMLKAASLDLPAGSLRDGDREREVRLVGGFTDIDDVRQVPLPPGGDPAAMIQQQMAAQRGGGSPRAPERRLRLGDIAEVSLAPAEADVQIRLQQRPAVGIIVTKQGSGNTVALARDVQRAIAAAPLPDDVEVIVARNTAATVAEALADVNASILLGILLCAVTIFVFLRSLYGTLIVATSIPVCLIGTFAPMAVAGATLNQMTLLGLALSVGILVDDSIVCLEAIAHRLRQGEPPAEAALHGRNDIALADTSTTLIDLAVFVPIAVMPGIVGQFFRDFGFVVACCAALSLLSAYTLVPMLAAWFYRGGAHTLEDASALGWLRGLEERYRRLLRWALAHRGLTLGAGWGAMAVATLLAATLLGVDFIPAADLGTIVVNVEVPAGSSEAVTEAVVARAEALAAEVPEVETLFTTLGRIETGFGVVNRMGPRYAQINITLRHRRGMLDRLLFRGWDLRRRSDSAVADELRERLRQLPEAELQVIAIRGWGGSGAPIDFSLYGPSLEALDDAGDEVMLALRRVPGLLSPQRSWRLGDPEVQVTFDRDRGREAGVYPAQVARELRIAISGEAEKLFTQRDQTLPVRLRLRDEDRRGADDVARIPVGSGPTRTLMVGDVATLDEGTGPTRIDRRDATRELNFKAYLDEGVTLGEARTGIEQALAEVGVPSPGAPSPADSAYPTLSWGWRGDAETLANNAPYMAMTALVGMLLVYLIMAVLFNSAIHPLTIMLSVPMAFTGALGLLVLTGSTLSIVSGIGFILLVGIVVRNAILLIDYILQQRSEGVAREAAVEEAGARRLQPILMTTLTTILGMLPVALKIGAGAEIRSPMAIAVIGGLAVSTLLTLVIIPVTYTLFDDWSARRG